MACSCVKKYFCHKNTQICLSFFKLQSKKSGIFLSHSVECVINFYSELIVIFVIDHLLSPYRLSDCPSDCLSVCLCVCALACISIVNGDLCFLHVHTECFVNGLCFLVHCQVEADRQRRPRKHLTMGHFNRRNE